MNNVKQNKMVQKIALYVFLILFLAVSIFPFYWMFVGATNDTSKMFTNPPTLVIGERLLENINNLNESIGIWKVLFNSLFVSLSYVLISLAVCTLAAYALAKFKFKGSRVIFIAFLLSMMIPYQATIIPLFQLFASLNLLNTYFALIVPQLCYPFAIFLMRQNFMSFPTALLESSRIDGAGELRIFLQIVLPSMKPALAATAIFLFMMQWNNFMWPLVAISTEDMYTFPVALSSLIGFSLIDYGQVMSGIAIATVPIIIFFLLLQRHFIAGMLGSAVK
ncbi:carbohydrate ABC transporter permease [Bacillus suaedae]|uniref:Carbohydrate ABC transporter permease n=1 Tax=Halalkalibacter suaedae TaxID=2822140 RepID=A0A940X105_9BACI|nr:carbohydrate ABC transporter permease [Bacillus suaedae]MBP3952539.1 carbohydrate ABC transporter permease [Bacillus suaedae]